MDGCTDHLKYLEMMKRHKLSRSRSGIVSYGKALSNDMRFTAMNAAFITGAADEPLPFAQYLGAYGITTVSTT
jgi:hypothetical protein